jgi:hypothetical protein
MDMNKKWFNWLKWFGNIRNDGRRAIITLFSEKEVLVIEPLGPLEPLLIDRLLSFDVDSLAPPRALF